MNVKPLKTVVIGCGMISKAYFETMINKFKILNVVGCCDIIASKAEETAKKYDIKPYTMEEILSDSSIELVINLTIPPVHYEVTKQLLENGKHVYTEKVLAVKLEEAEELVNLAAQKNLYLGVAPDTFLGAAIQTARYVVDSGMIGEITSCYCALNRDVSIAAERSALGVKQGGGIGFDVGIYYITALLSILGPVKEVSGIMRTRDKQRTHYFTERIGEPYELECETIMAGTLDFENGTVGNVLFDSNTIFILPEQPSLVLFGTKGIMFMADPNRFGGDVKVILKGNIEPTVIQQSHGFQEEYRGLGAAEMAWSIRKGRKNRANKEMAFHALEVLTGIGISCESKTNYALKSTFEKMPPIPRGYLGTDYVGSDEESGIAL